MPYTAPAAASAERMSHVTGTMIAVPGGQKPVEQLEVGDLVLTKDNGAQPIRWIASRALNASSFKADPSLRPIRIQAGALGDQKPERDLVVSQNHCVLISDWRCELLFGEDEVLAPAKALLNDSTITIDHTCEDVTYYHFIFDQHEIVYSNNVETESFHPAAGLDMVDDAKREELFKIFPQLEDDIDAFGPQARASLTSQEVEVLMAC